MLDKDVALLLPEIQRRQPGHNIEAFLIYDGLSSLEIWVNGDRYPATSHPIVEQSMRSRKYRRKCPEELIGYYQTFA